MGMFGDCFDILPDPRTGNAQRRDFLELLIIALAATLSGAETCVDFELFARSKEDFLREFLALEGGVPSHDTFSRLFRLIDPEAFAECLQRFAQRLAAAASEPGIVAIGGKGLRTALAGVRNSTPLALVNAFASANGSGRRAFRRKPARSRRCGNWRRAGSTPHQRPSPYGWRVSAPGRRWFARPLLAASFIAKPNSARRVCGHLGNAGRRLKGRRRCHWACLAGRLRRRTAAGMPRPFAGHISMPSNRIFQAISKVADRIDRIIAKVTAKFFPKLADMALDNILFDVLVKNAIDGIEYLRLADTPPAMLD